MNRRNLMMCLGSFALMAPIAARASDKTILRMRGAFAKAGPDGGATLSLADLDALPQTRFATTTPWHTSPAEFSGVSLEALFKAMGVPASNGKLQLIALNDYVVDAETAELVEGEALLATRLNGEPMPVSDKGPIFIVFPFDRRAELQHQTYYSRAVWQLAEIDLVP